MSTRSFLIALTVILALAAPTVYWLQRDNARLSQSLRAAPNPKLVENLRAENDRGKKLLTAVDNGGTTADAALDEALSKARTDVAALESVANDRREARTKADAAAAAQAANLDPVSGLVSIENFKDQGRATPTAAMQSLFWAAMNRDDEAVASRLTVAPDARAVADTALAALPEETRKKVPSPERLAALGFSQVATGNALAQFLQVEQTDSQHATVTVRFERSPQGMPLRMVLQPEGWTLLVEKPMVDQLLMMLSRGNGR